MKIGRHEEGFVVVIEPKGKITIGEGDVLLREEITRLLGEEKKQLVLDLGGISYMDSAGVGELVSVYTSVKNRGGELKLSCLTKKIKDLLQITQLMTIFDTYETTQEAVSSFK
ncbi:STAS domain-containing protein [bacterium]|nr:STAS domain-containing protein [bacterium]MCI0606353.1 STAS domain-containing protein [bacterium]